MASHLALPGQRRGDVFFIEYNDPNVIIEVITDPKHPEFDPRALRPVDPVMVESLRMRGQEVPAEGYKDGKRDGKTVVVLTKGRGRWAAMQQAWTELLAAGQKAEDLPPFRLLVKQFLDVFDAIEAAVIENEHRVQDDPVSRATKLKNYLLARGGTESPRVRERARILFHLKDDHEMKDLLSVLGMDEAIQAQLRDGRLSLSAALIFKPLKKGSEEHAQAIESLKEEVKSLEVAEALDPQMNNGQKRRVSKRKAQKIVREATGQGEVKQVPKSSQTKARIVFYEKKLAKAIERGAAVEKLILEARIEELHWTLGESAEAEPVEAPVRRTG